MSYTLAIQLTMLHKTPVKKMHYTSVDAWLMFTSPVLRNEGLFSALPALRWQ